VFRKLQLFVTFLKQWGFTPCNFFAPSNQPKVAGVFPQRNVGLEVNLSLSLSHQLPQEEKSEGKGILESGH